ncbi:MAG: hypothetical protein V7L21_23110 [Nostoc sp.]|uniref:hypothetical protein n=1 Tax=unclassified Nostoc TaxID=2593658 RepID=UPI0025D3F104|nr:hypothetical protein [Nostoc sp. NMS9]MBN3944107.1 hypothetical protein [Nostoc sp. NMS9]
MTQSLVTEPKYELWRVTVPTGIGRPNFDIDYLCADRDMVNAVLYCIYGHYDFRVGLEKEYYPLITKEHPTAIVIPPMPRDFRQLVYFISLQTPVWD